MIEQAHAERMRSALESIIEGLRPYEEGDPDTPLLTVEDVIYVCRRALNPDEWTQASSSSEGEAF